MIIRLIHSFSLIGNVTYLAVLILNECTLLHPFDGWERFSSCFLPLNLDGSRWRKCPPPAWGSDAAAAAAHVGRVLLSSAAAADGAEVELSPVLGGHVLAVMLQFLSSGVEADERRQQLHFPGIKYFIHE